MKCHDCKKDVEFTVLNQDNTAVFRNRFYPEQGWVSIVLCADCERDCIGMAMIMDESFGGE